MLVRAVRSAVSIPGAEAPYNTAHLTIRYPATPAQTDVERMSGMLAADPAAAPVSGGRSASGHQRLLGDLSLARGGAGRGGPRVRLLRLGRRVVRRSVRSDPRRGPGRGHPRGLRLAPDHPGPGRHPAVPARAPACRPRRSARPRSGRPRRSLGRRHGGAPVGLAGVVPDRARGRDLRRPHHGFPAARSPGRHVVGLTCSVSGDADRRHRRRGRLRPVRSGTARKRMPRPTIRSSGRGARRSLRPPRPGCSCSTAPAICCRATPRTRPRPVASSKRPRIPSGTHDSARCWPTWPPRS